VKKGKVEFPGIALGNLWPRKNLKMVRIADKVGIVPVVASVDPTTNKVAQVGTEITKSQP
jgi:hypothetical protein